MATFAQHLASLKNHGFPVDDNVAIRNLVLDDNQRVVAQRMGFADAGLPLFTARQLEQIEVLRREIMFPRRGSHTAVIVTALFRSARR